VRWLWSSIWFQFCLVTVRLEPYLTMCGVAGWPSAGLIPQEYPGSNPGAVPVRVEGGGTGYLPFG
jgi:hypothetical protein